MADPVVQQVKEYWRTQRIRLEEEEAIVEAKRMAAERRTKAEEAAKAETAHLA